MYIEDKEKENLFKKRFKFEPIMFNPFTYDPIVEFTDVTDGTLYKIEMATAVSLETILENIIKEKRDKKIKNILE